MATILSARLGTISHLGNLSWSPTHNGRTSRGSKSTCNRGSRGGLSWLRCQPRTWAMPLRRRTTLCGKRFGCRGPNGVEGFRKEKPILSSLTPGGAAAATRVAERQRGDGRLAGARHIVRGSPTLKARIIREGAQVGATRRVIERGRFRGVNPRNASAPLRTARSWRVATIPTHAGQA